SLLVDLSLVDVDEDCDDALVRFLEPKRGPLRRRLTDADQRSVLFRDRAGDTRRLECQRSHELVGTGIELRARYGCDGRQKRGEYPDSVDKSSCHVAISSLNP